MPSHPDRVRRNYDSRPWKSNDAQYGWTVDFSRSGIDYTVVLPANDIDCGHVVRLFTDTLTGGWSAKRDDDT